MEREFRINKKHVFGKKAKLSYLQIAILIVSSFAFAYLIASIDQVKIVKAQEITNCCLEDKKGILGVDLEVSTCASECSKSCVPGKCSELSDFDLGCCYDSYEGICAANTVKANCLKQGGSWSSNANCNVNSVQECMEGCCILGSETALVTSKRCQKLASEAGLIADFRTNINTELSCLALSQVQEIGACKLTGGGCKMLTGQECFSITGKYSGVFYKDLLCTSSFLSTTCKKTENTICVEGKDEVYFADSCGNPANIYDSSKLNDKSYWERVVKKENSCSPDSLEGNANSKSCGNCNYYLGSKCTSYSKAGATKPNKGENICADLNCKQAVGQAGEKKDRRNGESWCVYDGSVGVDGSMLSTDVAGSRHFKYSCVDGEVKSEPCADYRNEICVQSDTQTSAGSFSSASCRVNSWQKCIDSNSKKDNCPGFDCFVKNINVDSGFKFDVCAPKYPEGFDVSSESSGKAAEQICGIASQTCTVVYVKQLKGACKCVQNCNCEKAVFTQQMNDLCVSLGDCGGYVNIAGQATSDGYTVSNAPGISVEQYKVYAEPVKGQKAEPGTVSELIGNLTQLQELGEPGGKDEKGASVMAAAIGISGAGLIIDYMNGGTVISGLTSKLLGTGSQGAAGAIGASGVAGATGVAGTVTYGRVGSMSWGTKVQGTVTGYDLEMGRNIFMGADGNKFLLTNPDFIAGNVPIAEGTQLTVNNAFLVKVLPADATRAATAATEASVAAIDAQISNIAVQEIATDVANAAASSGGGDLTLQYATQEAATQVQIAEQAAIQTQAIAENLAQEATLGDMADIYAEETANYLAEQASLATDLATNAETAAEITLDIAVDANVPIEPEAIDAAIDSAFTEAPALETPTSAPVTTGITPQAIISAFANLLMLTGIIMTIAPLIAGLLGIKTSQTGVYAGTAAGVAATYAYAVYVAAGLPAEIAGSAAAAGAISSGLPADLFIGGALQNPLAFGGLAGIAIGIIIAVAVMAFFKIAGIGKVCKKVIVTYTCKPWQPPVGGSDCGKCNGDKLKPCSKYRCESLGAACQFINEGTKKEMCASAINDGKAPVISPWYEILNSNYSYVNVSEKGFQIKQKNGECIQEFTPFLFGIKTDKISQCKLDMVSKNNFNDMQEYFGGSNLYLGNHSMGFSMPNTQEIIDAFDLGDENLSKFVLDKLGNMRFYVRCQDMFGQYALPEYIIDICIRQGPDRTAPIITDTFPKDNSFIAYNKTSENTTIWTSEPANCKWSKQDKNYADMENSFSCQKDNLFIYRCNTDLDLKNSENTFYFRCKDHPEWQGANESQRNENTQSYVYKLKVSAEPLRITKLSPNGTRTFGSEPIPITIEAETSGGADNGNAYCSWQIGLWSDLFKNTGTNHHSATLSYMPAGSYKLEVSCADIGGNIATLSSSFNLLIDSSAPIITRMYNSEGSLYIFTNENSECAYSTTDSNCGFIFENANQMPGGFTQEHSADWTGLQNYYIKCRDIWGKEPYACSIKVKAYNSAE